MARFTSPDGTGAPGPTGPSGADGADALWNFLGEYDNGADYSPGDVVTYNGGTYYRVGEPNPGYPPGTSYWTTIADPGADGAGLPTGGDAGQILAKIDGTDFNTEWIENYTSTVKHLVKYVGDPTIPVGTPVYAVLNGSGNSSTNIPVNVASNTSEATSSKTMGLIEAETAKNEFVYVVTEGLVEGIDTSLANTGDPVWLGASGAYIFGLANKPAAPDHLVFLGVVTRGQSVNGEIFVKVQNGFELEELHTVSLESAASITNNEVLAFDSASGLWKNQTAAEAGLATSGAFNYVQVLGTKLTGVNGVATIISGSITTNGYPVHIIVTGDADPDTAGWTRIQLYRGETAIGKVIHIESSTAGENSPYAIQFIDTPSAGTYTYSLRTSTVAGGPFKFGEVDGPVMCIMELGK